MYCNILMLLCVLVEVGVGINGELKELDENSIHELQSEDRLSRQKRLLFTTPTPQVCKCGQDVVKREVKDDDDVEFRIIGGRVTRPHEYPQTCQILCGYFYYEYCACSIVNSRYVMTAAHCIKIPTCKVTVGKQGGYNTTKEPNEKTFSSVQIIKHLKYIPGLEYNDIAVIKLNESIDFNQDVKPACLTLKDKNYTGQIGIAVGWGVNSTDDNSTLSKELQEVDVPIISNEQCKADYNKLQYVVMDSQMCAGYPEGGKDTCQGDSGGPLFVNSTNPPEQCGIISSGRGCAQPNQPGLYTKVGYFTQWIIENTQVESGCQIYSYDTYP